MISAYSSRGRLRISATVAGIAAMALHPLLMSAEASTAQDPKEIEEEQRVKYWVSRENALESDAEAFARVLDMRLSEARQAVVAQNDYAQWLTQTIEDDPSYATSKIDLSTMRADVYFTGADPNHRVEDPDIVGLDVRMHGGAAVSRSQAAKELSAYVSKMQAAGFVDFSASMDEVEHTTRIVVGLGGSTEAMVRNRVPNEIRERGDVAIKFSEDHVLNMEARGGGRMDFTAPDNADCTTGFTVEDIYGTTGVVTAGHCDNIGLYYWFSSSYGEPLDHQGQHYGGWGDFDWFTVAGTEWPEFYAHHSEIRDYEASAYAGNGMTLCNYGRATDRNFVACAEVIDDWVWAGDGRGRLVQTDSDLTIDGDSGGPWYAWNTGYGIHSGDISGTNVFSQVHYIDDALYINTLKK